MLNSAQIDFYDKNRYIKIKQVLSQDEIEHYNQIISDKVAEINDDNRKLEERDTYGKAFLQLFNLWTLDDEIKKLVFHPKLAEIATQLIQSNGVRLYHDQALFKEAGGGITPWHADQYYWPFESDKTITAWIPLQATPLEMGPLEFSAGSHQIKEHRDLAIGDESEALIKERLRVTDFKHVIEPFDIGEVSFHSGWIFHRAGANVTDSMRKVMTIIYIDKDIEVTEPQTEGQRNDLATWLPGAKIGGKAKTPLNPILFEYKIGRL